MKKIKNRIVRFIAQRIANVLIEQLEIYKDDETMFYFYFEKACQLNAYCIVFHDIYLD